MQTVSETQHTATASSSTTRSVLTRKDTISCFTRQTGLPEFIVSDSIALRLDEVQTYFADRIIGQPAAINAMVDLIAVIKAGLSDPNKPLGTFLFIGPTGVGKTQLAKTEVIAQRTRDEWERSNMNKKEQAALPKLPEPEIVRVYQFEGERMVRDLRTHVKTTETGDILEGRLDDFILAYLRDKEPAQAYEE